MAYPSQNIPTTLGTFVDGQVVSANDATFGLNPKMEQIRSVVNDHAVNIDALNAQVSALGGIVYNVVAYGADPTGVANSTTAIQNAINAAVANQGIVVFSNGIYRLNDTLNVTGTCYITSDGAGQGVTLFQTTSTKSFFNISSGYVRITDLKMDFQAVTASTAMIYRIAAGPAYLSGIVIQRCQFYSSTSRSFTAISIPYCQASLISDCTVTGSSTTTVYFAVLTASQNVSVSRNICTSCTSAIVLASALYGSSNRNIIIDQNTISTNYADAITITEGTNIYIEKNVISNFRSAVTTHYAVKVTNASYPLVTNFLTITGNLVDNSSSASTTLHGSIYAQSCSYLNVSNNSFNLGRSPVTIIGSFASATVGYNQIISDNFFIRPFISGVSVSDFGATCSVKGNTFIDVVASSGYAVAVSNNCVSSWGGGPTSVTNCMIVANNALATIGTTGFTYLNTYGIVVVNGSLTQKTLVSGNDFTLAATAPYSDSTSSIFAENATGDKIVRITGSTAPVGGTWKVGDQVLLDSPTAGGYIGYVCTTAGTPGTWKGFGAIQV